MEKIYTSGKGSIDVKRFYLPIEIKTDCPNCGSENTKDFDDEYLSYPSTGEYFNTYQYCDNCEEEYSFKVKLDLQLTLDTDSIEKE